MVKPENKFNLKKRSDGLNVLVASRDVTSIETIENILKKIEGINLFRNHICNGHSDPLYGLSAMPDLLIFWAGENWLVELEELMDHNASERPPLIICADHDDPQLMRLSMKAGAIDYLKAPLDKSELSTLTLSALEEHKENNIKSTGSLTAVMNAKGGSGSSFISCNIADLMIESSSLEVALIGLDIQFASLAGYLDMQTEYGLVDALNNIEDMDSTALQGYMTKHHSGLYLLDTNPEVLLMPEDIDIDRLTKLFDLLEQNYDQIVVDLPRHIDLITSTVIDRADHILVVMQQSIAHIQDAKRLIEILRRDLGVSNDRLMIAINRYDKNSDLTLQDIAKALKHDNLLTVPNAFDQVTESINGGEPLYNVFRRSAITKSLLNVKDKLIGIETEQEPAGLQKMLNRLRNFKS